MNTVLLLFRNTREVIKAEEACRRANLALQVIATPKYISSDCGMCLQIAETDSRQALELITPLGIQPQAHSEPPVPPAFDLLTTVKEGGCSAKLAPDLLTEALHRFPAPSDPRLLVGLDTCDDAGVVQISDDIALIETTDFFPPICSDAYEFGQIAAANALSDVFAMGGQVLSAMNLVMFPASGIPLEVLGEILRGGREKVVEAGGIIVGGHTIADSPPKYGLAVTGTVHPSRVIANSNGTPGQTLILTKPLGTGVLVAGQRVGEADPAHYRAALESMKQLNRAGAEIMQNYGVACATDITGFGLLGHALHIARASGITLEFDGARLPALAGVRELISRGCIPGGAFRNQTYIEGSTTFGDGVSSVDRMLALDPQTSGGLLMLISPNAAKPALADLHAAGYPSAAVVGRATTLQKSLLSVF
ncbi:MAG TPA: selenide, water dikinase SelD [Candidatus Ozemobacteraceae bacterium]|nr:selenide, water dikinase SelD [Candidatus Ozemobacteraceae bacterium]